ncbi:putative ATP-dependent endonuclease of OLD family [Bradyrhizobium sp. S3.12.5]|uniref:AAA family ATPase n=1 Tax=Bradyrhizobium sp. S3.12.5 TaxID=3156386 RepID=UPI0033968191
MHIDSIEIANFRKLRSTRVSFARDKTVFVGANNSGKTSAMVALRYFLVSHERTSFTLNDFTVSHWPSLVTMGASWEKAEAANEALPEPNWNDFLPTLDVWLHVESDEVHYVQKILPTLDWEGGQLGVRLRFEPKDAVELQREYLSARADAEKAKRGEVTSEPDQTSEVIIVSLWPDDLVEFLRRRLARLFVIRAYVLDPVKRREPEHGTAKPQDLAADAVALEEDPFRGLIKISEISAQRGFGQEAEVVPDEDETSAATSTANARKLSEQLRRYYSRHLDPYDNPDTKDVKALQAIEQAQKAFDTRLNEGFEAALKELEELGYPGVTDPKLEISTRLRPVEGLNHEAAVRYVIQMTDGTENTRLHLPEDSNGLGYQNLISMVFRLMSYRDAWMLVGKAETRAVANKVFRPPLHLVLVEEPEAHLHTQVQQVFIRQAYNILRKHRDLGDNKTFTTQLVVSTHSSHIAHECDFASLRYFRRLAGARMEIPSSCVVDVSTAFGSNDETRRFVTRYLKVTHCDLFFADAAVLIEGPAERILTPHFVREHAQFKDLRECYITWLEIGGSHAHRLRGLIECLALPTLIITDLDAVGAGNKSALPTRGAGQTSRNQTLNTWCPKRTSLDELLDEPELNKILKYDAQRFSIRVAYQSPVKIDFRGSPVEALANTFEDAILFENISLFLEQEGTGLVAKFKTAIEASPSVEELSGKLAESLKTGSKAELALDLLEFKDANKLRPPTYMREGLLWLSEQVRERQKELGLAVSSGIVTSAKAA